MCKPKISIIVPIYKAEAYLSKCVDSLVSQTFSDFEILLIDDGSPDKSGEICDAYAKRDNRIRVVHQSNCGVSIARQRGLDMALGQYVIHADPDDWVEPNMLESLYTKIVSDKADMVICDFYVNYGEKQEYVKQQPNDLNHNTVLCNLFQHLHGSCCNKLIRKDCIDKYCVRFDPKLTFCEDLYFNASLLLFPFKIAYMPQAFYHYEQTSNPNSLANKYRKDSFNYDVMLYSKFCNLLQNNQVYEICKRRLSYLIVSRAFYGKVFTSKEFKIRCLPYYKGAIKDTSGIISKLQFYIACHGFYSIASRFFPLIICLRQHLLK